MSQSQPICLRRRCVRLLPFLLLGGLCLTLTACGAGSSESHARKSDSGEARLAAPSADPNKANQETYTATVDNPFQSVAVAPLSTFSADVNTASYSNVRRFLLDQNCFPYGMSAAFGRGMCGGIRLLWYVR
jgi:Ca-activated chloride channel family protein